MQRRRRLRKRRDFSAVYSGGSGYRNNLLTIRVRGNDVGATRFGFAVGKAAGGAVERNRVKRRLRDVARAAEVRPGLDIVVGAQKAAGGATFAELRQAFLALLDRADALSHAGGAR